MGQKFGEKLCRRFCPPKSRSRWKFFLVENISFYLEGIIWYRNIIPNFVKSHQTLRNSTFFNNLIFFIHKIKRKKISLSVLTYWKKVNENFFEIGIPEIKSTRKLIHVIKYSQLRWANIFIYSSPNIFTPNLDSQKFCPQLFQKFFRRKFWVLM